MAARSRRLGDRLIAYIDRVCGHSGFLTTNRTFTFAGAAKSEEDLHGATFWRAFVEPADEQILTVGNNRGQQLTFRLTASSSTMLTVT